MITRNFSRLPPLSLNLLSGGAFVFIVCLGIRVARAPEVGLRVANTQLIIGSSANKLSEVAVKLDTQAEIIKQKDEAYENLRAIYEESLKGQEGYGRLQGAIEEIQDLPEVKDTRELQTEISATKKIIKQVTSE
ncbi:hypothetical protein [Pleurocapsa sp. FMAR1]|uniref:hypothetical protein n=1 Tax=Pleurocapsa sp. FMAR1 TaxID=3040204 RepID=UPI0029C86A50|nr:hypothetical protein [Pleurocapsa sp. FMAR1]